MIEESPGAPLELQHLAQQSTKIDQYLKDIPAAPEPIPELLAEVHAAE